MNRISALKTIVTIAFIISVITVFFGIPFTLILAVAQDRIPQSISNISANHLRGTGAVLYLLLTLGSTVFVALALRTFKDSLTLFEKRIFFDNRVITQLQKSGKAFVGAAVLTLLSEIASVCFAPAEPGTSGDFSYGPALLLGGLGLLFLVLGDVFEMARKLKEENDLTV
ncbi:DUF2975 domain-containing protein [Flavobacterium sp. RHBU_3]|uniref:DUF2975 domain-containing protein n=1 Tax=Flavobacterium sp. RHBU_3 TaxID=3391184 RepID=UPI003984CA63